jgi:hypothetical protein
MLDSTRSEQCVLRGGLYLGERAYSRYADRFHDGQKNFIKQNGFRAIISLKRSAAVAAP